MKFVWLISEEPTCIGDKVFNFAPDSVIDTMLNWNYFMVDFPRDNE